LPDVERPVVSSFSITKKAKNRDAHNTICNNKHSLYGVIVADGIGNHEKVEVAAQFVVDFLKAQIEQADSIEESSLEVAFENCKTAFDRKFRSVISNPQFGTTAIVALEYPHSGSSRIKAAYVGNGAIWHIKGNFNQFSENQRFPWNSINYLNPHSEEQNGKEALYNCISFSEKNYLGPSSIDFSCDSEFGDIVMICTDGIYSYDQMVCSEDGFGEIWLQYNIKMKVFYRYLAEYFKQGNYNKETLEKMLYNYLSELKEMNLLDDDATLGLIISCKAMEYQKSLLNESADKN